MKTALQSKLYFGGISASRNTPHLFPKNSILDRLETKLGNPWLPWYVIMPEPFTKEHWQSVPNLGAELQEIIPNTDNFTSKSEGLSPGLLMLIEVSTLFTHEDWLEIAKIGKILSNGNGTLLLCRNISAEDTAPPLTWHDAGYREKKIFLMDELIIRNLSFPASSVPPLSVTNHSTINHIQEMKP